MRALGQTSGPHMISFAFCSMGILEARLPSGDRIT